MIKSINLLFGNEEEMVIDAKFIDCIKMESDGTMICGTYGDIKKINMADHVLISINKSFNETEYHPLGFEDFAANPLDRIENYHDITSINVVYDNGNKDTYAVAYIEGETDENECESVIEIEDAIVVMIDLNSPIDCDDEEDCETCEFRDECDNYNDEDDDYDPDDYLDD